ncbi:MAG: YdcF family protein [Erysipelotrichaceae bacterium]
MFILIIFLTLLVLWCLCFPKGNRKLNKSPYIGVILGSPTNPDGSLSMIQKQRCDLAIHYYQTHVITKVIVSGGAVQNKYVEAETMVHYLASFLPNECIIKETKARNTYENIKFSNQLVKVEDSILYLSSSLHLRRAHYFIKRYNHPYALVGTKEAVGIKDYLIEFYHQMLTLFVEIKLFFKK